MFSLESPNPGDSYEYTQYHFQYKKANHPKSAAMGFFSKGTQERAQATVGFLYIRIIQD